MSLLINGSKRIPPEGKWMTLRKAIAIRSIVASLIVGALFAVGFSVTIAVANFQREQYFEVRKFQAAAAAANIEASDLQALTGSAADDGTPAFEKLRSQLIRIKKSDERIRFVYLMRPQGGRMVFLVDAEDPASSDYSPPGQVYYEAKQKDFYAFEGKASPKPTVEGPLTDRWGIWISATSYVLDEDGKPIASMGTDVNVEKALASFNQIKTLGLILAGVASLLLALILLQWILWRYNQDKREAARLAMEEAVIRLNADLVETDRLKSEFIESVSHELRGPVTAVNGAMQALRQHLAGKLDEDGETLLGVAVAGVLRTVDLVNNLLDMTRIEAGGFDVKTEKVNLKELVDDTVKVFEVLAAEKGLEIETEVSPPDAEAEVDGDAVRRVLENLISNSIKYTDSGTITVEAATGEDSLKFAVGDTGRGIPERFQEEVFNKFSRLHLSTDSRQRGAGLGLAISKGLIEAHGGRIWMESEEGKGTIFFFEIPLR